MELEKLSDRLFKIIAPDKGRPPLSHSFLVKDEVTALIDAGCGIELLKQIQAEHHIDLVICSHHHTDHVSGAYLFQETEIYAPIQSKDYFGRLEPTIQRVLPPQFHQLWKNHVVSATGFRDCFPNHWYQGGQLFDLGLTKLRAVHAPGHTDDHHCLFEERTGVLLSFDITLASFGPAYGHPGADMNLFRQTLHRLAELQPSLIRGSHGSGRRGDQPREALAFFESIMDQRSDKIFNLIGPEGASREEILDQSPIFGGYNQWAEVRRHWEGSMIKDHLAEMIALGRLVQRGERYFKAG